MKTLYPSSRSGRRGFTLIEVAIAIFIVVVVSLAGAAYYANARIGEITEWHEANALYLAEREIESWQAAGYTSTAGFQSGDVSPNWLPYGYRFGAADSQWNQSGRYKPLTIDGFQYRVKAMLLHTNSTGSPANDYFTETTAYSSTGGAIAIRYRSIQVVTQWGSFNGHGADNNLRLETRIAR
jgi:prepilin-type N-terminal cleavage/methylation domain-containing protein